jgi:hypothetical protein
MNTIQEELLELPIIGEAFIHILDFISSLESGEFVKEGTQWVYRPRNFITITIHSQQARNVTVCLRGNPQEFAQFEYLPLRSALAGYSRYKMEEINQLDAALCYIRRAHELSLRGRSRTQKALKIVET